LLVCYFVAPSLTRGCVCNLLLLLGLTLFVLSCTGLDHILLSQFLRVPQPGGPSPRIYIPQEQGGPVIPPGTGFPFRRLLRLAGLRWRYLNPPSHGLVYIRYRENVLSNPVPGNDENTQTTRLSQPSLIFTLPSLF
jgi:hypothetical protein